MKRLIGLLALLVAFVAEADAQSNTLRNFTESTAPPGTYFLWCQHPTATPGDFKCAIDPMFVSRIGTEAKFESVLGFQIVVEGEVDIIGDTELNDLDAPSDEECLTYETTGGQFEWQTCGGGGGSITVGEADGSPNVGGTTTIQFDQADGLTVTDETGGQVQIDLVGVPVSAMAFNPIEETELDTKAELVAKISDVSDFAEADGDVYTGTHDFSGATFVLAADVITAAELKDTDTPGDEECMTYEITGNTFEWQSCGGAASIDVEEDNVSVDAAVTNLDFGAGFDVTSSPAGEANVVLDYTEDPVNLAAAEVTGVLPGANIGVHASSHQAGQADEIAVDSDMIADDLGDVNCDGTPEGCFLEPNVVAQNEVATSTNFTYTGQIVFTPFDVTASTASPWTPNLNRMQNDILLDAALTVNDPTTELDGGKYLYKFTQDGTGGRAVTLGGSDYPTDCFDGVDQSAGAVTYVWVDSDGDGFNRCWNDSYEVRSMYWSAGALSSDGTNCADPAEVTIGSWGKQFATICTDNDASIMTGTTTMPDGWDAGTVTFELLYIQDAVDALVLNADVAARCAGATETPVAYGTEVAIDDAAVTGTDALDATTSAAVTPAGTCAAGDLLQFQVAIDAAGTTTAMATLNFVGVKMEYATKIGDE